jgi:hypothetical protein
MTLAMRDSSTALRFARNDSGLQEAFIEVLKAQ